MANDCPWLQVGAVYCMLHLLGEPKARSAVVSSLGLIATDCP
jgi:hypothetical protein